MSKEAIAIKALEALARLGNGEQYGNSTGNVIARTALFEMAEQPAPAAREWVGLTDEERDRIWSSYRVSFVAIGHIESKLKEKNT